MKKIVLITAIILSFICNICFAKESKVLNIYVWYGEIPASVIKKFEKETGIHVNVATYNDNEVLYAKLKANPNSGYDLIEPSSYYVSRMSSEGMLQPINKSKLSNFDNIAKKFKNPSYDPHDKYSIPYLWGVTGIFVNKKYFNPKDITSWQDLWNKKYFNQIMLLNDPREVYSMGLMTLGLSPNSSQPQQIKKAYHKLLKLLPNIKMFNSQAIPSIFIDDDATIGMAWNGDIHRAQQENPNLAFIYPKDGFVIWVDCLAIPKNAPHLENAYKFLNFLLQPENANQATLVYGYATPNEKGKALLPKNIRENKTIFPDDATLSRGHFQQNISDNALKIYAKYWELLKLSG